MSHYITRSQRPIKMYVTFIPGKQINSDLGIVNAARVSLSKKHEAFEKEGDKKLLSYLLKNKHWTPFAHSRLYFILHKFDKDERLEFYSNNNTSGMVVKKIGRYYYLKASVFSLLSDTSRFSQKRQDCIFDTLCILYPETMDAKVNGKYPTFVFASNCAELSEEYIAQICVKKSTEFYKLLCVTLLIKVPIFIARQIRTSQVGFAYSDNYVESESFVFNEVSRRYVSDEPEFYDIKTWRVRKGESVKQGSTGVANKHVQRYMEVEQDIITKVALENYTFYMDEHAIAPEQARALLPQSMYTE